MAIKGTFEWNRAGGLRVNHEVSTSGELNIWFTGSLLSSEREEFDRYLAHLADLEAIAAEENVAGVRCHLDELGETVSRGHHAIYRMLSAMREGGVPITIVTSDSRPEFADHQRMSKLFADGLSSRPGPPVEVVAIGGES